MKIYEINDLRSFSNVGGEVDIPYKKNPVTK
jgi:hypothetical protein